MSICLLSEEEKDALEIISINADSITSDKNNNLILEGGVVIELTGFKLWSNKASITQNRNLLKLSGNIRVLSETMEITAKDLEAYLEERYFQSNNLRFNYKDKSFAKALSIDVSSGSKIEILNSALNNCSSDDPDWELTAKQIVILEDQRNVILKNIQLKIRDIPLIFIPYYRSSIGNERLTGFLTPTFQQGKNGLELSLPYYFNLAPNYDLQIAPRYIESRGLGFATEFRHLNRISESYLYFSMFPKDKIYTSYLREKDKRWFLSAQNTIKFSKPLEFNLNLESTSDIFYFNDIREDGFGNSRKEYLTRLYKLLWDSNDWKITLTGKDFYSLNPYIDIKKDLAPSLDISKSARTDNFIFDLKFQFSSFKNNLPNSSDAQEFNVDRMFLKPEISFHREMGPISSKVKLGTKEIKYSFLDKNIRRSFNSFELELRTNFYKPSENSFGKLSPTLKYLNRSGGSIESLVLDSKLNKFSFDNLMHGRFYSGNDIFVSDDRVIFGLEHYYASNANVRNYFAIGRSFSLNNLKNKNSIEGQDSNFILEMNHYLGNSFYSLNSVEYNPSGNQLESLASSFSIKREEFMLSLSGFYRKNERGRLHDDEAVESYKSKYFQIFTSFSINDKLEFISRFQKDFKRKKSTDILYGFQKSDCCFKYGLIKRKWQDRDYLTSSGEIRPLNDLEKAKNNIYFYFELRDLGTFGKDISKIMSSSALE
tara:strand:+ start:2598 stop:4730 length:2133 start_codon:yes stop_codon:yes gene_type:complete